MVRALQSHQIDVEIATTNDDGDSLLNVRLQERIVYDGIPAYFFPRFSPPVAALREFNVSGALTTWLRQNLTKYDALHVHTIFTYPPSVAMAIARRKGVPYVVTPHGMLCEWSLQQKTQKKQAYLQLIDRANINGSQSLHLTSQPERDEVRRLNFKSPTFILPLALTDTPATIPNAAVLLRQKLSLPLDEPIILFLSRLHYVKGLNYLIPALGKLTDRRFTFVIAGSGTPEYEAEIRSRLQVSGIKARTRMMGFVEGEEKNLLIQGANLFALTSHLESFGLAILEALAVGTPALVTPGVALAPTIEANELGYVPSFDIESIATALDRFLGDPDRAKVMGDRAREFVLANYTWDYIAPNLIRVYQSMIDRQPLPVFT